MPQDDKEIAALIAALTPAEQAELEAALGGGAEFTDVRGGGSTTAPEDTPRLRSGVPDPRVNPDGSHRAPQGFAETMGEMAIGDAESLDAQAQGSMDALPLVAGYLSGGLPGIAGSIVRNPAVLAGVAGGASLYRGNSPWRAMAEASLAGGAAKGLGALMSRWKAARILREMEKGHSEALSMEQRAAAALDARVAGARAATPSGEAVGVRQPIRSIVAEPPSVARLNRSGALSSQPAYMTPEQIAIEDAARAELQALQSAPSGTRLRVSRPNEPPSVASMNRPYTPPPSQGPPPQAPPAATAPTAPPPSRPQPSRLGATQQGTVPRSGPTTADAANLGNQARAAIASAKQRLSVGDSPEEITKSFVSMGVRADIAKEIVAAALRAGAGAALISLGTDSSIRNRRAASDLSSQAKGVVP